MEYKRISKGINNYDLYPSDYNTLKLVGIDKDKDFYESLYTYEEKHYNQYKEKNSLAGIKDVKTDKLIFDFDDNSGSIENARRDAIELTARLYSKGVNKDDIQIYFSGNKGFHVQIDTNEKFNRKEFENIVFNLAGDLKTLDPRIKDQQRIIRVPFSKHEKSGLRKIPLSQEELENEPVDVIRDMADFESTAEIRDKLEIYENWKDKKVVLPQIILSLKESKSQDSGNTASNVDHSLVKNENTGEVLFNDRLELHRKPGWLSSTRFALQEGFFIEGERHNAFMILAATYKAHGFSKQVTYYMLKGTAELQAKRTGGDKFPKNELWTQVINSVYSNDWRGGTYSQKEEKLLKDTAERFNLDISTGDTKRLYTIGESIDRFKEYAKNFSKNRIKIGIEEIDEKLVLTTGMMVGLLGAPGSGKTTFSNKFMKQKSAEGENVLFECLDMTENFIIARFVQSYVDLSFEVIMELLENDNPTPELVDAMGKVGVDFKNVHVNYKSGTNVEDIENDIVKHKEMTGNYPRLVVIDYLEKIRGPYTDATANSAYVASRLADLAREYNTLVLVLLQPQKSAGDANQPILSMRKIKGASVIEQDCRAVMTLWRLGANRGNKEDDKFMSAAIVKNNMGELSRFDFAWDGLTGSIKSLDDAGRMELENLKDRIAKEEIEDAKKNSSYNSASRSF